MNTFGVWQVLVYCGDAGLDANDYTPLGIFRGHVDDIAFRLPVRVSESEVLYFRRADAETVDELLPAETGEWVAIDVFLKDTLLTDSPSSVETFFEGREVFAEFNAWGPCIRMLRSSDLTGEDAALVNARQRLNAVLAKLGSDEIELLERYGLNRYRTSVHAR